MFSNENIFVKMGKLFGEYFEKKIVFCLFLQIFQLFLSVLVACMFLHIGGEAWSVNAYIFYIPRMLNATFKRNLALQFGIYFALESLIEQYIYQINKITTSYLY